MADLRVEASAGGGMVVVSVNGHKHLLSIRIDPDVVDRDDIGMLQDLIVAAVNDAHRQVDEELKRGMGGLLSSLGLPGVS
jgi:DNA-binding YbaB/EbfC family protein